MMDYHQAGLDREVAALLAAIAASGAPALETLTPNEARASVALMREMLWPPVPDVIIRTVEAGDQLPVRIRIYRPPNTGGDQLLPGMIYFHGGGWVVGDRGGSVCLNSLAGLLSGLPAVDHAAARSGWWKYTSSGVRQPRLECGRPLL